MAILIISTGGLIYDGITNVIVSYLEAMDLTKLDIYVAGSLKIEPGIRKKIKDLGCRIVDLPDRRKDTITYFFKLVKFIRKNKINVLHAHGNSATLSIEMLAGVIGGCKTRIAHSHNTKCEQIRADRLLRPLFYRIYTEAMACGVDAGKWLFGERPFKVLKNGRNIDKYKFIDTKRKKLRKNMKLKDELVIGHVGGFVEQKNHRFILEIFKCIKDVYPNSKFFLVGDGNLRSEIEDKAKRMRIYEDIKFTGNIENVEDILQIADGMILPSLFEGVPLVTIEWQISGLPILISDNVSDECICTNLVKKLSLKDSPKIWAENIIYKIKLNNRKQSSVEAERLIKENGFDIKTNAFELQKIYELGEDGRLVSMQLEELIGGLEKEEMQLVKDYLVAESTSEEIIEHLENLGHEELMKQSTIAKLLGYESFENYEDLAVYPKGYRILNKVPRMPSSIVDNLVKSFKSFQHILVADINDLDKVDGIGEVRAEAIKQYLRKMQEQFAFDNLV